MTISFLCKVVDNFGDIGVVYRLSKQIAEISPNNKINLIVDDLDSFNKICNEVKRNQDYQFVQKLHIFNWHSFDFCFNYFLKNDGEELETIIECFQCGRPDWMEQILFEKKLERTVKIIMLDYLTAEDYAETFHCMESLTRSKKVQKVNFMPGFTNKTGGLIIDNLWRDIKPRNPNGPILFFTYEKNFYPYFKALNKWFNENNIDRNVLVAQGKGKQSFIDCYKSLNKKEKFGLTELDFINQNEWDVMMQNCSILVIRGEESMARACLSGIPFVWNAYPQSEEYQLVKVQALLEKMRPYFSKDDFCIVEKFWILFNTKEKDVSIEELEFSFFEFLNNSDKISYGFKDFSIALRKNGDLATNLMTYIEKNVIMLS